MTSRIVNHISVFRNALVLLSLVIFGLLTAVAQEPSPSPAAQASGPSETGFLKDFQFVVEVGGQYRDVSGERPSKFEEYKSVRNGFLFRRAGARYNPENSPAFFNFAGRNISERDQQYMIEGGKYGRFRTTASWNAQPLLYSRGATSLLVSTAPGVLVVPDSIRQTLSDLDMPRLTTATTLPNPALIAATQDFVANAPRIDVRTQRHTLTFEQEFDITSNWSVRFRFVDHKRYGQRPLGTGTYERVGTPTGDTFRVHSIELPSQIDYRTDNFTFGTSYLTQHWGVNFDYTFSKFRNSLDSYIYDNPFRVADEQASGSGGVFNRGAFARGLHSVMPDNESHSFVITAFADLPFDSRWAGAFGWSRWTQDELFLPYTLNTAIVAGNLGGLSPTDTAALPQESLEGEVDNLTIDQLYTLPIGKRFTVNLRYRAYNYNNKTEPIHFPGYAAFLESFWRTAIGTRQIENEPVSYLRQRAAGELIWDVTRKFRWRGEYEWEGWNREHRQVNRSNEHKLSTFFSYKPLNKIKVDLDYRYQDRTPRFYNPGPLENPQLRMFDQAKRLRHDLRFRWQWAATPKLGIAGDFNYSSDDYDANFFGTTRYIERGGGVDLLYNLQENTTVYANYSREHYNTSLQSIAKTGAPFDLRNRWNRDDRNINDNFGIGTTTYLAQSKWFLDVNYALNFGRDLITTSNPTAPAPSALLNATAFPFPEAKFRYHEFSIDSNYQITSNVALGTRYYYEPFRLDDWQWNGLSPYPVDQLAAENDGRRFVLLDSRYSSHNAHIFTVYLRFNR